MTYARCKPNGNCATTSSRRTTCSAGFWRVSLLSLPFTRRGSSKEERPSESCFYETYRFSEDLDFTVIEGGPESPDDLVPIFGRVSQWLFDRCGVELVVDASSFRRRHNLRGRPTTEGKIAYRGPRAPPTLPKLKIDITSDEAVVAPPDERPVFHPYSDAPAPPARIRTYSIADILAEKLRALAQRCRPRDLYDVINVFRHPGLAAASSDVRASLARKCAYVGIPVVPDYDGITASPLRADLEESWSDMLAHQLPHLPPVEQFWTALAEVFSWLLGQQPPTAALPRAEGPNLDLEWVAPAGMRSWRGGVPLELIRFAGANRLRLTVEYRAENGRVGPRKVEPYSLRRTKDGHLLLYVVNDQRALRSYRIDRIVGASVTGESFVPIYQVEF